MRLIPIILFVLLSFFLWRGLSLDPHHLPSVQIGRQVPSFHLPELAHPNVVLASQQLLHGHVVLLNVWASWCSACIEEQEFLLQLAQNGVVIYGLNYKDDSSSAQQWLQQWGNPYKKIFSDRQGSAAIDLGVYGAPETFVVDKQGIIRYRHAGVMTQDVWLKEIKPLMAHWEHTV